jgi:hypothetical protein
MQTAIAYPSPTGAPNRVPQPIYNDRLAHLNPARHALSIAAEKRRERTGNNPPAAVLSFHHRFAVSPVALVRRQLCTSSLQRRWAEATTVSGPVAHRRTLRATILHHVANDSSRPLNHR